MRTFIAAFGTIVILMAASCRADEGNLVIRCPGTDGAIAVADGQATVNGVMMRVSADLATPPSAQEGMTFVIEVRLPDTPGHTGPSVDCVRVDKPSDSARWDARPYLTDQNSDGSLTVVRAKGDHGPHWAAGDAVDVTVWLTVSTHRYPLTLGRQPIHP